MTDLHSDARNESRCNCFGHAGTNPGCPVHGNHAIPPAESQQDSPADPGAGKTTGGPGWDRGNVERIIGMVASSPLGASGDGDQLRALLADRDRLDAERSAVTVAEQWRAAYDAKVGDFARETAKLARLVDAVVADGHRDDALTRHNQSCGVCVALREATEDAHTTGGDHD